MAWCFSTKDAYLKTTLMGTMRHGNAPSAAIQCCSYIKLVALVLIKTDRHHVGVAQLPTTLSLSTDLHLNRLLVNRNNLRPIWKSYVRDRDNRRTTPAFERTAGASAQRHYVSRP